MSKTHLLTSEKKKEIIYLLQGNIPPSSLDCLIKFLDKLPTLRLVGNVKMIRSGGWGPQDHSIDFDLHLTRPNVLAFENEGAPVYMLEPDK